MSDRTNVVIVDSSGSVPESHIQSAIDLVKTVKGDIWFLTGKHADQFRWDDPTLKSNNIRTSGEYYWGFYNGVKSIQAAYDWDALFTVFADFDSGRGDDGAHLPNGETTPKIVLKGVEGVEDVSEDEYGTNIKAFGEGEVHALRELYDAADNKYLKTVLSQMLEKAGYSVAYVFKSDKNDDQPKEPTMNKESKESTKTNKSVENTYLVWADGDYDATFYTGDTAEKAVESAREDFDGYTGHIYVLAVSGARTFKRALVEVEGKTEPILFDKPF